MTADLLSQQPQTKAAFFKSFHYSPAAVIINNCRWCVTIGCLNNVDILVDIRTRTVVDYWSSTCSPDRISMKLPPAEAPDGVESETGSVPSSLTDWRCQETRVHCSQTWGSLALVGGDLITSDQDTLFQLSCSVQVTINSQTQVIVKLFLDLLILHPLLHHFTSSGPNAVLRRNRGSFSNSGSSSCMLSYPWTSLVKFSEWSADWESDWSTYQSANVF